MNPMWFWYIYLIIYSVLAIGQTVLTFSPGSILYQYHHVLASFDGVLILLYYLAVVRCALLWIGLIPVLSYVHPVRINQTLLWRWIFFIRILVDVFGSSYEMLLLKSMFVLDARAGWSLLGVYILPLIPSYVAHFQIAFPKKKSS